MTQTLHFISGLPRAGSTLLCAILRQNPRFHAAMTSPVASLCLPLIPKMCAPNEFAPFFTNDRRRDVLRAVFQGYYREQANRDVIFDTNRLWCGKIPLLADLFPICRIICCVREIGWIIDSVERLMRRNPLELARIFQPKPGATLYGRIEALMDSETGLVGSAWTHLREAFFSAARDRLLIVNYENFVANPEAAMRALYNALGEPHFVHDFAHITYEETNYDASLGMPGLHSVRPRVSHDERAPCVPPDVFAKYKDSAFWAGNGGAKIIC